jgi:hypothetical protein
MRPEPPTYPDDEFSTKERDDIRSAVAWWARRQPFLVPLILFLDGTSVRAWELRLAPWRADRSVFSRAYWSLVRNRALRIDHHIVQLFDAEMRATDAPLETLISELVESRPEDGSAGSVEA